MSTPGIHTMRTVVVDKVASIAQACGLSHEVRIATTDIPCEEGVVLVVEVLTNKSTYNTLELTSGRMLPKASAIETAIRGGVRRVHVISYAAQDALLAEVFTNEGTGTLVVADTKALSAAEQGAA